MERPSRTDSTQRRFTNQVSFVRYYEPYAAHSGECLDLRCVLPRRWSLLGRALIQALEANGQGILECSGGRIDILAPCEGETKKDILVQRGRGNTEDVYTPHARIWQAVDADGQSHAGSAHCTSPYTRLQLQFGARPSRGAGTGVPRE